MKKNMLICFFGMDGSGKSSLSSFLVEELKNQHFRVDYYWWLEAENSFIRKFFRIFGRGKFSSNKIFLEKEEGRGKSLFSNLISFCYSRIVLLNYLLFGIIHSTIPYYFSKKRVLIFDRYYFDTICSLRKEFGSSLKNTFLFKVIRNVIPFPNIIFFIDVQPDLAFQRKKDELLTMDNAKKIWNDYKKMQQYIISSQRDSKNFQIDNSKNIENTKNELLNAVREYLVVTQ